MESSCDTMPTSLVLVKDKEKNSVIGHSKITPIPSIPDGCFVESGKFVCVSISYSDYASKNMYLWCARTTGANAPTREYIEGHSFHELNTT